MSTLAPDTTRVNHAPAYRLSFPRVVRSEAIKLTTLRSTWWSIGVVVVLSIGFSLLVAGALASSARMVAENGVSATFTGVSAIVAPIQFTMLLAGALGAIAITGEYSTGMIRSSLTAEPRRGVVLAAKAIVVAVLMAVTSLITFGLAAVATAPLLTDIPIDWGNPEQSTLPILYGSLSMAVFALLGLSFGFILRSGPGAIAATVGLLFVLPIVANIFSFGDPAWQWIRDLSQYLPMNVAQSLTSPSADVGLSDPVALLALGGWVAAGLLGAWAVLRTRDA